MADYSRYDGMKTRSLETFNELSSIMSEYKSEDNSSVFLKKKIILALGQIVVGALLIANSHGWMLLFVLSLLIALIFIKVMHETDKRVFKDAFLERAIDAGFSRSDAAEFLYDTEWNDFLVGNSQLDQIRQDNKNAKNQ